MRFPTRWIAALLALCLLTVAVPFSASALTAGDFTYELSEDGLAVTVTDYTGTDTAVVIPSEIDGLPVTKIAKNAFGPSTTLTEVTFPDTLTVISSRAFEACTALTSISLPASLETIGSQAFYNCSTLKSIELSPCTYNIGYQAFHNTAWLRTAPDGPLYIGRVLYSYCGTMPANTELVVADHTAAIAPSALQDQTKLKAVYLPVGLRVIGSYAFADCADLIYARIPPSVTTVQANAFSGSEGVSINGVNGSTIETYATDNKLAFVQDATLDYLDGDMDKNGAVTSTDFRILMRAILLTDTEYDHERFLSCDILYDGTVDTRDLREWMRLSIL